MGNGKAVATAEEMLRKNGEQSAVSPRRSDLALTNMTVAGLKHESLYVRGRSIYTGGVVLSFGLWTMRYDTIYPNACVQQSRTIITTLSGRDTAWHGMAWHDTGGIGVTRRAGQCIAGGVERVDSSSLLSTIVFF